MAKFSKNNFISPTSPIATTQLALPTHEGGRGYAPTLETELFVMAATSMAGEGSFYESADQAEARFVQLVHDVTAANPSFVARFAPYLRGELKIRSAAIALAAEYVAAGGANGRSVVNSVLQRGDEPAEMLGYWHSRYGRRLPMPVKRGIADGAVRLYTERAALRYDGAGRGIRMADVIELTHPKPQNAAQSALFRWLLDHRHHHDAVPDPSLLPMLASARNIADLPTAARRELLSDPKGLANAGMSWERLSGWVPGGMDAAAWESVIDSMGVMALIRNLRNFDQRGISERAVNTALARISDTDEVAKARLFPYQVWAAYKNAPSDRWKRALASTLELTTQNIPALDRSLIVIDMSGSMQSRVSRTSTMTRVEVAAVMAAATARRSCDTKIVIFGATNQTVGLRRGASTLGTVEQLVSLVGSVGHSTHGHTAIARHFRERHHDRVIIFTDDQMHDAGSVDLSHVPLIYTVDLAGYRPRSMATGNRGRYTIAGFSDATFQILRTLEMGAAGDWPFWASSC